MCVSSAVAAAALVAALAVANLLYHYLVQDVSREEDILKVNRIFSYSRYQFDVFWCGVLVTVPASPPDEPSSILDLSIEILNRAAFHEKYG